MRPYEEITSFEMEKSFESVAEKKEHIATSEDVVVSKVGRDLHNKFFRGYTRKKWELDASVIARVPTRTTRPARSAALLRHNRPMQAPLHLVDATMFWSPTGGGVRRYLQTKHAWLAEQPGWRHTIAVPATAGEHVEAPLPSLPLPFSQGYRLPVRRRAIARVLTALRPDVIEVGDPYRVAWAARDAAERLGIPAVAYCHSNIAAMARLAASRSLGNAAARAAQRYARHVYAGFDLVLAPSRSMTRHLKEWGVQRVATQPLGVDTTAFHPSRRDPAWRARHGIATDARVLVFAGRFAPEKHLDVVADAVRRLGPPYVFVAIGAGPAAPRASAQVKVLPFVSGTAELATALASADAFVHAGDQETFGLSVLEAMACGTPAVVRDAEGLAELVDERTGVTVQAGHAAAFAEAIATIFARDAAALAAAARSRAESFDWERVFVSLLGHYQRSIDGASATVSVVALPSASTPASVASSAAGIAPPGHEWR